MKHDSQNKAINTPPTAPIVLTTRMAAITTFSRHCHCTLMHRDKSARISSSKDAATQQGQVLTFAIVYEQGPRYDTRCTNALISVVDNATREPAQKSAGELLCGMQSFFLPLPTVLATDHTRDNELVACVQVCRMRIQRIRPSLCHSIHKSIRSIYERIEFPANKRCATDRSTLVPPPRDSAIFQNYTHSHREKLLNELEAALGCQVSYCIGRWSGDDSKLIASTTVTELWTWVDQGKNQGLFDSFVGISMGSLIYRVSSVDAIGIMHSADFLLASCRQHSISEEFCRVYINSSIL